MESPCSEAEIHSGGGAELPVPEYLDVRNNEIISHLKGELPSFGIHSFIEFCSFLLTVKVIFKSILV